MTRRLAARDWSYGAVGATVPDEERWTQRPPGHRAYERTVRIGYGEADWRAASAAVLEWGVKTRSGFAVRPEPGARFRVAVGARFWLVASVGPLAVREPVRVVAVVERPDRCGFAYGTLEGHPVSGEEAFIVSRTPEDIVQLTLRSLTGPSPGRWRPLFPVLLAAQRWYRARYVRALRSPG